MPTCHACGAPTAETAAFCGECGSDLGESPGPGGDVLDTGEQIIQRVKSKREFEEAGGLGPRVKGAMYAVGGVAAVGFGYWIGFVGYTETQLGPQGFGVYQITYPIPGVIILLFGLLAVLAGLAGLAGEDL